MREKILALLFAAGLLCPGAACFAQLCPSNFTFINPKYDPPKGWHVTQTKLDKVNIYRKLDGSVKPILFSFYIAVYNFDHVKGANNNSISCIYKDHFANLVIEITTDQQNLPKPAPPQWQALDADSLFCAPLVAVDIRDCPWG